MFPNVNTMSNFSGNSNPNSTSCSDRIKAMWAGVPLFVRFVVVSTVCFYFANLFIPYVSYFLANVPLFTLFYFQIWRLLTTVLISTSIFNILFAFLAWVSEAIRLEQTIGTVRYSLYFLINSVLIQALYSITLLILVPLLGKQILSRNVMFGSVDNSGLWPVIMCEITLLCLANPESLTRLFFIPYQFRAKFYPFVLLVFFSLFNGIQFDLVSGVAYGHMYFYYLKRKLELSDQFILKAENTFIFKWISKFTGFVPFATTSSNAAFMTNNQQQSTPTFTVERPQQPVTTPFKGKGTVVGKTFF